jgi:hypothetical protein
LRETKARLQKLERVREVAAYARHSGGPYSDHRYSHGAARPDCVTCAALADLEEK